jgi:sterol desaturase/sphingolipid hydroxylase (fatty acid hydroxylase superfamily)
MKKKKFHPKTPGPEQMNRDRIFTTLGFTQSSVWECVMLHAWASNSTWLVPYYADFWQYPAWSIFQVLIIGYWRDFHFFWIHRFMHPWKTKVVPDVGKFMYNNVHSLHHKSYITAPWSGLAMHPVEHLFYYSCTLLTMVWSLHPFHFWMNKIHADISPLSGHDGHDMPAGGSYFHHIHHAKYEYNYGTPMVPMDKLFGTYADGSQWKKEELVNEEIANKSN